MLEIKVKNETEKRYVRELKKFLKTGKDIETYIREDVRDRKQLSKLNCSLKLIDFEDKEKILENIKKTKKPKFWKRPEPQFKVRNIENAINRMKNKRMKIAFRLQEISGLRISELSNLKIDDISINQDDNRIIVKVLHGKGDKERTVKCLYDKWVLDNLIELEPKKDGQLFYCAKYMMDKAKELNFHTHDLRKTFANIKYYNNSSDNAIEELQEDLGHSKHNTIYKKYLSRDINTVNTRWDKLEPLEGERTDLK